MTTRGLASKVVPELLVLVAVLGLAPPAAALLFPQDGPVPWSP